MNRIHPSLKGDLYNGYEHRERVVCHCLCMHVCETLCDNVLCISVCVYVSIFDISTLGFMSPSTPQNTPAMTSTSPTQSTPAPTTDGGGRLRYYTYYACWWPNKNR